MVTDVEGSTMIGRRTARHPLALAAVVALVAAGCSEGKGVEYSEISGALAANCARCHDADAMGTVILDVDALADDVWSAANFPDSVFVPGLLGQTQAQLFQGGDTWMDKNGNGALDAEETLVERKAWILHELYELDGLLAEAPPPDYTTQAKFDTFAKFGNPGAYEGCEIGGKLDLGYAGDPEGMAPLWADKIVELLVAAGKTEYADYRGITPDERQKIREYVDQLLPGGLKACSPDAGSGS